jgi:HK97 family phage prohead protease
MNVEYKSSNIIELKDVDTSKREAVLAHATYDSVDRTKDIARKGMFSKSWKENKDDISYYVNHDPEKVPGRPVDFWEDNQHAYTKVYHGTHTLGNDTLIMMDEGIIKKVSFGYIPEVKSFITHQGQKVRELKQVKHIETSVLTKLQAHPGSTVVSVTKAFENLFGELDIKALTQPEQGMLKKMLSCDQLCMEEMVMMMGQLDTKSDLYTSLSYMISQRASMMGDMMRQLKWNVDEMKAVQQHIETMEKFVRNTKASDECIKSIQIEIEETKSILSGYDVTTQPITGPGASSQESDSLLRQLLILKTKI